MNVHVWWNETWITKEGEGKRAWYPLLVHASLLVKVEERERERESAMSAAQTSNYFTEPVFVCEGTLRRKGDFWMATYWLWKEILPPDYFACDGHQTELDVVCLSVFRTIYSLLLVVQAQLCLNYTSCSLTLWKFNSKHYFYKWLTPTQEMAVPQMFYMSMSCFVCSIIYPVTTICINQYRVLPFHLRSYHNC